MKKILTAALFFMLATIITWYFIASSPLYISRQQMLLSGMIAGAKWAIQLCLAVFILRRQSGHFIKNISLTCFIGSLCLLPYIVLAGYFNVGGPDLFLASLVVCVAVMIVLYALSVRNAGLSMAWWLAWMSCLAIAVVLQLTVVFHVW